jgi:hypothetical protein
MKRFLVEIDTVDFMPNGLGQDALRDAIINGLGYASVLPHFIVVRTLTEDEFSPPSSIDAHDARLGFVFRRTMIFR